MSPKLDEVRVGLYVYTKVNGPVSVFRLHLIAKVDAKLLGRAITDPSNRNSDVLDIGRAHITPLLMVVHE